MPSIKEKCVCQICICGKHHCGEDITFPSLNETAASGEQCKAVNTAAAVPAQSILKSSQTTPLQCEVLCSSYDPRTEGSGRQQLIEYDTQTGDQQHQQTTAAANSSLGGGCEQSRQRVVTTITTQLTRKTSQQRSRANKEEEEEEEEAEEEATVVESRMKQQQQQTAAETDGSDEHQLKQSGANAAATATTGAEADSLTISKTSQRKTWQTSPEEVEELTRSLSRLRTDPEHGGFLYEKMVEKEKSKTTTTTNAGNRRQTLSKQAEKPGGKGVAAKQQMSTQPILISSTTTMIDQPHLVNGNGHHHHHQQYVVKMSNGQQSTHQQPAKAEPFLPPLTGFSDSDSSFGSFSCSVEGDHHLLPAGSSTAATSDHRHVQCICESLKKSKLEETENFGGGGGGAAGENGNGENINFIDVDDNWIVTRPKRSKPRDNLRLEGPMEMETTFRSTYETTAQRMITDRGGDTEEEGSLKATSSKRSTAATSRQGSKGSGSPSSGLYLNTRRGRNGLPATPLLRSAKSRRRHTRNRPMTSLKAGGDGYYNTISRDAYKNFIIVNGEAKMVGGGGIDGSHHVKLPKVVTKTTLTTSEEKNRQKFLKSGKSAKISGLEANLEVSNGSELEKMVMIGGEQIRKFEKKSYIAKSDGGEEVTDVERKIIRKVKCAGPKDANVDDGQKEDDDVEAGEKSRAEQDEHSGTQNYTIDTISGAPKRPFHARYQDNIRELGLLDRSDEAMAGNKVDNYRHTMRRLHETSKDFNLQMPESPVPELKAPGRQLPKARPEVKVKLQSEAESQQKNNASRSPRMLANGSHVMARPAHKPFILPQRIQRHKNECSVNVFEGDIDFTTTNRWAYGDRGGGGEGGGRKSSVRVGSAQRKRTAGRRYLKSSKRRNLFRQSSDSMFSSPGQGQETGAWAAAAAKEKASNAAPSAAAAASGHGGLEQNADQHHQASITSTYQKNFDDRLYCPALDVGNQNTGENFKYTGEAGGHKYYLSSNYS